MSTTARLRAARRFVLGVLYVGVGCVLMIWIGTLAAFGGWTGWLVLVGAVVLISVATSAFLATSSLRELMGSDSAERHADRLMAVRLLLDQADEAGANLRADDVRAALEGIR